MKKTLLLAAAAIAGAAALSCGVEGIQGEQEPEPWVSNADVMVPATPMLMVAAPVVRCGNVSYKSVYSISTDDGTPCR